MSCTISGIEASADRCGFVREACTDSNVVDYFKLRYCLLGDAAGAGALFVLLGTLAILLAFYVLGSISDKYLSPGLGYLAKKMKLSEAVAGVTVLAFANGAPDIISSLSAGGQESNGVFISVGSLFGACLFATTVVLGVCILYSRTEVVVVAAEQMDPSLWMRDILFYIVSAAVVLGYGLVGEVSVLMAVCFFGLYFV